MEKYHTQSIASSRDASRDRERRVRAAQTSSRSTDRSIDHRDFGVAIAPSWATCRRPRVVAHATERTRAATTTTKGACMRSRIAIVNHVPFTSTNARRSVTRARRRQSQSINQSIAVVVVGDRTFGVGPCLNGSRDIRRLTGAYARGVRGDVVVQSSSRRRRRPVKA